MIDAAKQFDTGQTRVENQRLTIGLLVQLTEQRSQYGCFTGADFTDQLDKPIMIVDAVQKMGKSFLMMPAEVDETRIGSQRKGLFIESKIFSIHGR